MMRCLWLVGSLGALAGVVGSALYDLRLEAAWVLLAPSVVIFGIVPLLGAYLKEEASRLPAASTQRMARDRYYHRVLCFDLSLIYVNFFLYSYAAGLGRMPWWNYFGAAIIAGIVSGQAIIIGHELGHKRGHANQIPAKIALILVGYGHFTIQHNRGHHRQMATPEDCESSRMGESLYRFALRQMVGSLRRGWQFEKEHLAAAGYDAWSWKNGILLSALLSLALAGAMVATFGYTVIPFLFVHHIVAWYMLACANYVEHYGLLRGKLPNGRYESPALRHSWNINSYASNLAMYNLHLHSDHHLNSTRPYQVLRGHPDAPQLPNRFPALLAMLPWAWFGEMNPRVMALYGGDLSRANVDPRARKRLQAKYCGPCLRDPSADASNSDEPWPTLHSSAN